MVVDSLVSNVVKIPLVWDVVQRVLGYPEEKEALYRSAVSGGGALLDFGCASGHLAKAFVGVDYVGLDLDKNAIDLARKRWASQPNMQWVCADIFDKPFKEHRFDQVLIGCAVHHLSDSLLTPIMNELAFCLRPGGHLHIFDPVFQKDDGIGPRILRKLDQGKYTRSLDQIVAAVKSSTLLRVEHTSITPAPQAIWKDCDTGYIKALRLPS